MSPLRRWLPWIALSGVIASIELTDRFAFPFNLRRVLMVEAVLYVGASLVTVALITRLPRPTGWRRVGQWVLVAAFALAALRSGIWAAGRPVPRANLAIAVLGAITVGVAYLRRHRRAGGHRPGPSPGGNAAA